MRTALLLLLPALAAAACGTLDEQAKVRLDPPRSPTLRAEVGRAVGDLLGNDADRSRAGEARLLALDASGRAALLEHARTVPTERDPRWLHVLDEHRALPALSADEQVAFLLWKAGRPEPFFVSKAQQGLVEQARSDPAPLVRALERGGPGVDVLAVALALARRREAVPALVERYRASEDDRELRALSEALARLLGEDIRPRTGGTREERDRDAERLLARWRAGDGEPRRG